MFNAGQVDEKTIEDAGAFGKQFIILFDLKKDEDGFYRERRREQEQLPQDKKLHAEQ